LLLHRRIRSDVVEASAPGPPFLASETSPEPNGKGGYMYSHREPSCSDLSRSATTSTLKQRTTGYSDTADEQIRREPSRRKRGLSPSAYALTGKSGSSRRELPSPPSFVGSGISKLNQPYWRRAKGQQRCFSKSQQSVDSKVLSDVTQRRLADGTLQPCLSESSGASVKGLEAVSKGHPDSERTEVDRS
jgi:hypothetical protein